MALYAWGFDGKRGAGRWLRALAPLVILAISEWELTFDPVSLYPAALLLPLLCLPGRVRTVPWAEALTASFLGGLVCWKAADAWPLLPGLGLLCAVLLLIPILPLCRSREDRLLACALSGLLFELFFCLREYMLFSYCLIRLGSRDSLSLSAASVCLYILLDEALAMLRRGRKSALPMGN